MRAASRFAALAIAASLAATAGAQDHEARATMSGIGPIRIGMSVGQLGRALQTRIPDTEDPDDDACRYVEAGPRWPGTTVMLLGGRVARIDVTEPGIRTLSGAAVGDLVSKVRGIYRGRLRSSAHELGAGDMQYLTLYSQDRRLGIRFETDGERVTEYYVGTGQALQFVEGCL